MLLFLDIHILLRFYFGFYLNPDLIHSATFIVSDEPNNGFTFPFTIAKNAGIVFTPQYPGV